MTALNKKGNKRLRSRSLLSGSNCTQSIKNIKTRASV